MEPMPRYVGLDVHKHYLMVAALDETQRLVMSPCKISMERFAEWARTQLTSADQVVLEATTNAWEVYNLLAPLVASVKVAHPMFVKLISSARVKTDTRDTLHLAPLLQAGLILSRYVNCGC